MSTLRRSYGTDSPELADAWAELQRQLLSDLDERIALWSRNALSTRARARDRQHAGGVVEGLKMARWLLEADVRYQQEGAE